MSKAGFSGEKIGRAHVALRLEVRGHLLSIVTILRLFQAIAALVILKRRFEVLLILVGFAKRKTKVYPVAMCQVFAALLGQHGSDLVIAEFVDLKIGQRVIGLAMLWLAGQRSVVRADRRIVIATGFVGMAF